MGKPSSFRVDLQNMSSSTVKTQCVTENAVKRTRSLSTSPEKRIAAVAVTTRSTECEEKEEVELSPPPIPKLYISKSLLKRQSSDLPKMSSTMMADKIMRRLSIGPESMVRDSSEASLNYASKVFRKRHSSSSYDIGPKLQVIDHSEPVPGMLPTPVVRGGTSSSMGMSVFKSDACESVLRKFTPPQPQSTKARLFSSFVSASSSSANISESVFVKKDEESVSEEDCKKSNLSLVRSPSSLSSSSDVYRPKLKTPPLNDFFRKPRTVAEKRLYLLQSPVEYKVLDFENSVYHLIKKAARFKDDATFRTQVELLMYGTAPTNRNIWKAVLWLNSEVGRYQPWYLNIDGQHLRLFGATGTLVLDDLTPLVTTRLGRDYQPDHRPIWCCTRRMLYLQNEESILAQLEVLGRGGQQTGGDGAEKKSPTKLIGKRKSLELLSQLKPGPLSAKVRRMEKMNGSVASAGPFGGGAARKALKQDKLGPLEIYELPVKTMTAVPELNKKQPAPVCSYLKLVVPEEKMTREWLNYSLAVLQTKAHGETEEKNGGVTSSEKKVEFQFPIPYKNDQRKILVRRLKSRKRGEWRTEDHAEQMKKELTFGVEARKVCKDEELNGDVEKLLTEMIDSVAISFSEDYFVKNDPDGNYEVEPSASLSVANKSPKTVATKSTAGAAEPTQPVRIKKRRQSEWSSLRTELRRLNVAIIDTAPVERRADCTKDECRFGCVCESISGLDGLSNHCTKVECIFGCKCSAAELEVAEGQQLRRMRDEKISSLARAEKEFTSAVVLTNSNTILMSNSEDRKRNRTKPKRYYDYTETNSVHESDDELNVSGGNATGLGQGSEWKKEKKRRFAHADIQQLRHCAVVVTQIAQLEYLEPWCMVHELYRCFCDNKRIEGRPFKLTTAQDGTIRANVRETLMLNSRRRPVTFAKDETQDSLERLPVRMRLDNYCSRCTPTDFTDQFLKNKINADLINTKVRLGERKHLKTRLEVLVENCLKAEASGGYAVVRPRMAKQLTSGAGGMISKSRLSTGNEKALQIQQCIEEAGNELGLKIESVCTVSDDEELENEQNHQPCATNADSRSSFLAPVVYRDTPITHEAHLSDLKRRLLHKLNSILESCAKPMLQKAALKRISFVRHRYMKDILQGLFLVEVWSQRQTCEEWMENKVAESIILTPSIESAKAQFPDKHLEPVRPGTANKLYLSKFILEAMPSKPQSTNLFIVFEGSGSNFWYVRGCQYIRDPQGKIRIEAKHTDRLRDYSKRMNSEQGNLQTFSWRTPGNEQLQLELPVVRNTRFLMIDLRDDFSDLGHPRWKGLLSYKHIKMALRIAKRRKKTIRVIRGPPSMQPNIYATPKYATCVFAGPFERTEPCCLSLYQRMDNSLYLREEYETMLSLQREKASTGFWLYVPQPKGKSDLAVRDYDDDDDVGDQGVFHSNGLLQNYRTNNQLSAQQSSDRRQPGQRLSSEEEFGAEEEVVEEEEESEEEDKAMVRKSVAVIEGAETASTSSLPPDLLPELEIVSLARANSIKTERRSADDDDSPKVSITTVPQRRHSGGSGSNSNTGRSLLKLHHQQQNSGITVTVPSPKESQIISLTRLLDNPTVSTFRVGQTVVMRKEMIKHDDAVPGPSSAPDPEPPMHEKKDDVEKAATTGSTEKGEGNNEVGGYVSEDDDVVFVEDPEYDKIIDLDEWERVQQETSDEENNESAAVEEKTETKEEIKQIVESVPVIQKPETVLPVPIDNSESIPFSGYYRSNIPSLGNIPAKILNGIITLSLPIRKMPIKIGVDCVDRYMWKYLQNSISACFPQDLEVKWEFINSYFPTGDNLFKLDPHVNREYNILTKYGVINVLTDHKTEADIPEPAVYLKYLASRLCVQIFNKMGVYTATEIIDTTITVIKQERYKILKNNREISELSVRKARLKTQLSELLKERKERKEEINKSKVV